MSFSHDIDFMIICTLNKTSVPPNSKVRGYMHFELSHFDIVSNSHGKYKILYIHVTWVLLLLSTRVYCESTIVRGYQFSWFLCVGQTMKFGSQRKGESHWFVYWKPNDHEFKNPWSCVSSLNHENWYPRIKVLSQYTLLAKKKTLPFAQEISLYGNLMDWFN